MTILRIVLALISARPWPVPAHPITLGDVLVAAMQQKDGK